MLPICFAFSLTSKDRRPTLPTAIRGAKSVNFTHSRTARRYSLRFLPTPYCSQRTFKGQQMLDMIFTIGPAISAGLFVCAAFIAIDCALFPEHTTATIEELPEMGYDW